MKIDISKIMGSTLCPNFKMGWTKNLQEELDGLEEKLSNIPEDEWTVLNAIEAIKRNCLDYYKHTIAWIDYLRGESIDRPVGIKHPLNGKMRHLGEFLVVTIKPAILDLIKDVVEGLPSLNVPGSRYPITELKQMFQRMFMMSLAMDRCEEEMTSFEALELGLFCLRTYELFEVICVTPRSNGCVILEHKQIKLAFKNFYMAACNAAWAIHRKIERRDLGKIDVSAELKELEEAEKDSGKVDDEESRSCQPGRNVDLDKVDVMLQELHKSVKKSDNRLRRIESVVVEGQEYPHERSKENQRLVELAIKKRVELINGGMKERSATSAACKAIVNEHRMGKFKSYASFRSAVNDEVRKINIGHGIREAIV